MRFIKVLLLTPFWMWILIPFMYNYFEDFLLDTGSKKSIWKCSTVLTNYFGGSKILDEFIVHGKLSKAYVKVRLKALKLSYKHSTPEMGIDYYIAEEE